MTILTLVALFIYNLASDDHYFTMSGSILVSCISILGNSQASLTYGLFLVHGMYRYHRFEYYQHRNSLLALLFTTYFSMIILFVLGSMGFYLTFCLAGETELEYKDSGAFYTPEATGSDGICGWYVNSFYDALHSSKNKQNMSLLFFTVTMLELTPFIAFYFLNRPHDCFVCLGKDPDRIYSSLQLTKQERVARKMFGKYSIRYDVASHHYDNLVKKKLEGTWMTSVVKRKPIRFTEKRSKMADTEYGRREIIANYQEGEHHLVNTFRVTEKDFMCDDEFE